MILRGGKIEEFFIVGQCSSCGMIVKDNTVTALIDRSDAADIVADSSCCYSILQEKLELFEFIHN